MNVIRILIKEEKGGFITHGFAKYGDDTTNVLGKKQHNTFFLE